MATICEYASAVMSGSRGDNVETQSQEQVLRTEISGACEARSAAEIIDSSDKRDQPAIESSIHGKVVVDCVPDSPDAKVVSSSTSMLQAVRTVVRHRPPGESITARQAIVESQLPGPASSWKQHCHLWPQSTTWSKQRSPKPGKIVAKTA